MKFQRRLEWIMERGNLRVADLAKLFGRRHSTVRGWVVDGREPAGTPAEIRDLFATMVKIEDAIRGGLVGPRVSRELRALFVRAYS